MKADINENFDERLNRTVLHPLFHTTKSFYIFISILIDIIGWGGYAFITQLRYGLIVTGMRDVTFWGFYIINFVFFIGISHAGTLV